MIKPSKSTIVYVFLIILTIIPSLAQVLSGSIPFWFDPARDMLSALENLKKLTLLGPPTGGVPGVFYGPYWIWLQSAVLIFTKDPRYVALCVMTLPYFILFPLILWKMKKVFNLITVLSLWILFLNSFRFYTTFLWNPYLAPLLFLILTYLSISVDFESFKKSIIGIFLCGVVSALIANFSLSFGIAVVASTSLYLVLRLIFLRRFTSKHIFKALLTISSFFVGFLLVFLPTIIFEFRHGFIQSKLFLNAFINSAIYNSAVTGQRGMSHLEIIGNLVTIPAQILAISPLQLTFLIVILALLWFGMRKKVKVKIILNSTERHLLFFLVLSLIGILLVYLSTKNPIWAYHFVGVEVIFLLLLGILTTKFRVLGIFVFFWSLWLFVIQIVVLFHSSGDVLSFPSLASKTYIVNTVYQNNGKVTFSAFAYSPAIYTYDFDYLFSEIAQEKHQLPPLNVILHGTPIYLIIPETNAGALSDYIDYKTPNKFYKTVWKKVFKDKTLVLKRVEI